MNATAQDQQQNKETAAFPPVRREDLQHAVWRGGAESGPESRGDDRGPNSPPLARLRRAAVLCPILVRPGGMTVLLTRRADHLRAHAGQISFPGGKIDPSDRSPMDAALREGEEEIGLNRDLVDMIGPLGPYVTGTGFRVTPFVGFIDPRFNPRPDPEEVAEVFEAPLDFLMNPANHRKINAAMASGRRFYYEISYGRHRIWGATAGILRGLSLRLAAARRESR